MRDHNTIICAYLDGRLADEDVAQFQHLFRTNDEFVARFASLSVLNRQLNDIGVAVPDVELNDLDDIETPPSAPLMIHPTPRWPWALAAAVLIVGVALGVYVATTSGPKVEPPRPASPIASLVRTDNVVWASDVRYEGEELTPQRLAITSGRAQIIFLNGAVVDLTGPCEFDLIHRGAGRLRQGLISAFVPEQARGFTVDAPGGVRVTDLGTEFSMRVDSAGHTEAYVAKGLVRLVVGSEQQLLEASQGARAVGGGIKMISQVPDVLVGPYRKWRLYRDQLIADPSLVLMYDFADGTTDGEAIFNLAPTGESLDGVAHGASESAGRFAQEPAIRLNGRDDHVALDVPGGFETLTLTMWVKIEALDKQVQDLLGADGIGRGVTWHLSKDGRMSIGPAAAFNTKTPHAVIRKQDLKRWVHLALVADTDTGTVAIYRDGKRVHRQSIPTGKPLLIGPARLGHWAPPKSSKIPGRGLNGSFDELMIFNRPLDADEIDELYSTGRAP